MQAVLRLHFLITSVTLRRAEGPLAVLGMTVRDGKDVLSCLKIFICHIERSETYDSSLRSE